MKKIYSIFVFCLLITSLHAKVWTVDNTGKTANFTTTTAAVNGASAGDTLLVGGSATTYPDINLTKKLVIYGTGYFLGENPNTIETKASAIISNFTFSYGSDGSELIGMNLGIVNITTDASNITLRRCILDYITVSGNNNLIKQCYFYDGVNTWSLNLVGQNNQIRNNFMIEGSYAISSASPNIIENNVIYGQCNITSSSFGNNIIVTGTCSFTNCNPYNNICNDIQCGTINGNQAYVNMTNVFLSSGTSDGRYQLSATSVAKGAGLGGIDCGMFGGNDPYILSGMPDIPVITAITVPSRANLTNGLNVQINIRSNK